MGMGIGEKWAFEKVLANGHAARHVDFLHQALRQGIEKCVRIEAEITGIQVKVLDIQEKSGAGLAADQIDKLGVRHVRVRPFKQIGDVLQQERYGNLRLNHSYLGD